MQFLGAFNWNLFITLMTYIILIFAIVGGALKGFNRGLVRSSVRFGTLAVCIIIAGLISLPISRAIMKINVSFLQVEFNGEIATSMTDVVKALIYGIGDVEGLIESSPTLAALIDGLPVAMINLVVFSILIWIFRFLSWIIYIIIDRTAIKSSKIERQIKKQKKAEKKKLKKGQVAAVESQIVLQQKPKRKWLGALIGGVQGFILIFLIMLPFTSLFGIVGDLEKSSNESANVVVAESTENENLNEKVIDLVKFNVGDNVISYFDSYNNSVATKILTLGGLDDVIFDEITKVNTPNGSIKFRKELINFANVFDQTMEILNFSKEAKGWTDLNFDKAKTLIFNVLDTDLFNQLVPELAPYAIEKYIYPSEMFAAQEYSEQAKTEINNLLASYKENGFMKSFKSDLNDIFDVIVSVFNDGLFDEIYSGEYSGSSILTYLKKDNNKLLNQAVDAIYKSKLGQTVMTVGLNYSNQMLNENLSLEKKLLPYNSALLFEAKEKQSVKNIVGAILEAIDVVKESSEIENLSDDQIKIIANLLTQLQNDTFKQYNNNTLEARENVVVDKENLTATNGGPFSNLYITIVNHFVGEYIENINYKNANWPDVLVSVKNIANNESETPDMSDIMNVISLDEDLGEKAQNIAKALEDVKKGEELTNKEKGELLDVVATNVGSLSEEQLNKLVDKVASASGQADLKDQVNYEVVQKEKDVALELSKLYKNDSNNDISSESLNTIAQSELIVNELVKNGVKLENSDANIESKIDAMAVSNETKENLKALFNVKG